jgi:hypothetical protein
MGNYAIVAIVSTMLYFIITRQHWRNRLMTRSQRDHEESDFEKARQRRRRKKKIERLTTLNIINTSIKTFR